MHAEFESHEADHACVARSRYRGHDPRKEEAAHAPITLGRVLWAQLLTAPPNSSVCGYRPGADATVRNIPPAVAFAA